MTLFSHNNEARVYNPLSAGRRHARRIAVYGLIASVSAALVFYAVHKDFAPSLAALLGGLVVVVGSWISAQIALGGQVLGAGSAFARLLAGIGTKWMVVLASLLFGVAKGLPVFPILIGVIVATLAPLVAEIFNLRNKVS